MKDDNKISGYFPGSGNTKKRKSAGKREGRTAIQKYPERALLQGIHFNHTVKILFVEDNHFNQQLALFVLNKVGCITEIANSGAEAIQMVKGNSYDLILMDINMPGIDGYETTRILREELLIDIPIIAFTTHVLEEDVRKCMKAGMNDHIGKPYTEHQLASVIYKWTQQNF